MPEFRGFTRGTFEFLTELARPANCNKAWFDRNRDRYQSELVEPLKALVSDVSPALLGLNGAFEVNPAANKTLTRINRDMRFARNQPPYKDHMLALFYRVGRKKEDAQLFLGVQPAEVWSGLYVGGHLLEGLSANGGGWAALGKRSGVGSRYGLCVCERYGEVAEELAGRKDDDYLRGPHLVVLRRQPAAEVVGLKEGLAAQLAATIEDLYPLWARYSHA